MNNFYTYAWLREDGTPYYVGKGEGNRINIVHRRNGSKLLPPPIERRLYLKQNLSEQEAFRHEMYMIGVLGRKDNGTGILINLTGGGEGISGYVFDEETRKKMSESQKGKKLSEETKKKLSELNKGNQYRKGIKHTEEAKKKMGEIQKGKKLSEEHRRKISEAKKGQNKGRKHSEETKRKISEAIKAIRKIDKSMRIVIE